MWRDDAYLLDMLIAARKVADFMGDCSAEELEGDEMRLSAVVHQLQIIGEAASKVSREYRADHPEIAWEQIVGMRHVLVHDYRHIEVGRVWQAATRRAPELRTQLEPLIPAEESG